MKQTIFIFIQTLILSGCIATHQGFVKSNLDLNIDGDKVITLPMTRAGAIPTENEFYKIETAGILAGLKKGNPEESDLTWSFSFIAKSLQQLDSVTIEQVDTSGELAPMLQDKSPKLKNGSWFGKSKPYTMSRVTSPWLYSNQDSIFLFKFTIIEKGKAPVVMYQPSLISKGTKSIYLEIING
jgi:hypothetical protein